MNIYIIFNINIQYSFEIFFNKICIIYTNIKNTSYYIYIYNKLYVITIYRV